MAARKAAKSTGSVVLDVPKPDIKWMTLNIEGLTPLLCGGWSEESLQEMERAQSHAPKTGKRAPRDPQADYEGSMYRSGNGKDYLFPSAAFRKAAISACRGIDGLAMTEAAQLFRCEDEYVTLQGKPTMDRRPARLKNGTATIAYRARFDKWSCKLTLRYNARATNAEQLVNLLLLAGETVGVGNLRPEKKGNYGCFTIK